MIDVTKVHMMTRLAAYEKEKGKKDLKIHRYTRKGYLSLKLLETFFAVTLACLLAGGLYIMRYYTNIMTEGLAFSYREIIWRLLLVYVAVMLVNLVVTFLIQGRRYDDMRENIRTYDKNLYDLKKYLEKKKIYNRKTGTYVWHN